MEKLIVQRSDPARPPGGASETAGLPDTVKVNTPLASGPETLNVRPAHAVPAAPAAVGLIEKTPGSGVGHRLAAVAVLPHEGANLSSTMVLLSPWLGALFWLTTVIEAFKFVVPTDQADGTVNDVRSRYPCDRVAPVGR